MKNIAVAGVILASVAIATPALAGPPFETDDADPVEYGHFENNVYTTGTHAGGETSGTALGVEVNYGAFPDLEVTIGLPLDFGPNAMGKTAFGIHEVELGAKYRLIAEDDEGWVPGVSFGPSVSLPINAEQGEGDTTAFLPIWMQKTFGEWTAFGGGGYNINPGIGNRDFWWYGAGLLRQLTPNFALGSELFGQTSDSVGDHSNASMGVGAIYDMSDQFHLMGSVNTGIVDRANSNEYTYFFGFSWTP